MRPVFLLLLGCAVGLSCARENTFRLPPRLHDVDGSIIRLDSLARTGRVAVVTMKAVWCPVCRERIRRLQQRRKEAVACGVRYIVIAPGPAEDLAAIRRETEFFHPFVADQNLDLASGLGLRLSEEEIQPAFLLLNADRSVRWAQAGRGAGFFGDEALFRELGCAELI